MFTLTVYLVQHSLVADIIETAPPGMPNVFMIGITPEQVVPLRALVASQSGVQNAPEFLPSVAVLIESVNGVALQNLNLPTTSRRFRGSRSVMWAGEKPSSLRVVQGAWWRPGETQPVVSVTKRGAHLNLHVGD
jgi:putative ABC transport system permease protein